MANIGLGAYRSMLDWSLKTSSIATPASMFVGLSLGAPTTISFSEVGAGSGYTRSSMNFVSAQVPAGSATASNSTAATFGAFLTAGTVSGIFLADSPTNNAGSMFWYGTLAAARSFLATDQLVLAAGTGLVISLS